MATQPTDAPQADAVSARWSVRRWSVINAGGLATAFGLFALLGGTAEALGADHDGVVRDLSLLVAFAIGGSVWAALRQRALLPHVQRARRVAIAAVIGLAGGFVAGFLIGGPPLDFILGILAGGAIAGAVERRALRDHLAPSGALAAVCTAAWLLAAIAAIVPAALFGDAIDAAVGGGVGGFVAILLLIGLFGGAVGGALEGLALRRRLQHR